VTPVGVRPEQVGDHVARVGDRDPVPPVAVAEVEVLDGDPFVAVLAPDLAALVQRRLLDEVELRGEVVGVEPRDDRV